MNRKSILLSWALACLLKWHRNTHVHSFQLQSHPKTKRNLLTRHNVGIMNPGDWSDVKPNHIDNIFSDSPSAKSTSLNALQSAWTKYGLIAYVAHMCVFLPLALLPTYLGGKLGLLNKAASEHQALQVGQKTARTLLQWIPFMNVDVTPYVVDEPKPAILVSNHISMLDTFVFLAADEKLRGKNRRPIKTIYWKGLDANPICKILFSMAGFISVDMSDNGNGNPNEYNRASFKQMLKDTQKAIEEGFDIFVLPEGQLNPTPENGLQPILPGAYALAKSSKRPIQMVALHGCQNLWHADESIGMAPVGKDVKIKAFPLAKRKFKSAEEFEEAFTAVVGSFGLTGQDLPMEELDYWLNEQE
ncbi:hypothetical protein ACHAXR_003706 [Thalassiosira sp. AJA248-18]